MDARNEKDKINENKNDIKTEYDKNLVKKVPFEEMPYTLQNRNKPRRERLERALPLPEGGLGGNSHEETVSSPRFGK